MTGDPQPSGRRCPKCGARRKAILPGDSRDYELPGIFCTECGWGEIYYPPTDDDDYDGRDWC